MHRASALSDGKISRAKAQRRRVEISTSQAAKAAGLFAFFAFLSIRIVSDFEFRAANFLSVT
jgi:hypothetical protein